MKVKRREVQDVKLSNYYRPKRLTRWPDLPCTQERKTNVDIYFLFTFYRLVQPTNGWEGQSWSLGSNTYCVLSVRLSTYPSSIQYCCQILYLQKHENCRLLLGVRKDFSSSSFLNLLWDGEKNTWLTLQEPCRSHGAALRGFPISCRLASDLQSEL